ncbi:cyclin-dependent kinase inhibitor 1Bb [Thalassophryne amazonica]|uniref:cyclin-dependent kinase inhibitor 1Bb n=1 Tax=Thalassophryne amazonica TaxID=390379 RepID=UPI001471E67B|nr:cyclin-dependent kinase inhibitor 1Bb [Thalassophryne amazonica]XP_034031933.1 cyclin-dependent kinase inhibitor 1Bb [Thalassophryne amazonica]
MSDVRLSNGSPTLERTEPRLSVQPKPSACRSLFGSLDHQELKRDLKQHLRELEEAATTKWSFDFANHKPLRNGGLEWELVDCRDVPEFYSRQPRTDKGVRLAGNNSVDLNGNHNCVDDLQKEEEEEEEVCDGPVESKQQCAGLRKRPACHDPTAQNKRCHTSLEEVLYPNLTHSAERTPRKPSPKRQT